MTSCDASDRLPIHRGSVDELYIAVLQRVCRYMPFEIRFCRVVAVADAEQYINECCWAGDVIRDALLPAIEQRFSAVQTDQEYWGWFIWFRYGRDRMALDIFCDDRKAGHFRVWVTQSTKRGWILSRCIDGAAAEEVAALVTAELNLWGATVVAVERVDAN